MKPIHNFFREEFRALYRRECRWLIIFPEVARTMPARAVDFAVARHLERTAAQVIRLEEMFRRMPVDVRRDSPAVRSLLKEADEVLIAVTVLSTAARARHRNPRRRPGYWNFFPPSSCN